MLTRGTFAFIEYGGGALKVERAELAGERGFRAFLPFSENEALDDREGAAEQVGRAVEELRNREVAVILPPKNAPMDKTDGRVSVATGALLFPFFIADCCRLAYRKTRGSRDISHITALIAAGPLKLTELAVNCLAGDVKALNVAATEELYKLDEMAENLLYDYGVTLTAMEAGKNAYASADLIINIKNNADRYEHVYKEKAVLADISGNEARLWDIARRRPDITAFDGVRLKLKVGAEDCRMNLPVLELFMFVKSPAYRKLAESAAYDHQSAAQVSKLLERYGVKPVAICRNNKTI
ncbi:MAG: hypothetical protein LBS19_00960 [Clostridiales bacterium]|jgi:hypothetical protein|nr:hypothetical protein [Clostridiales bacterium]